MQNELSEALEVALSIAREAGEVIREAFLRPKDVIHKGAVDLVTETDKAVEKLVISRLQERFPTHLFLGEETTEKEVITNEPTWCIDPIDGTTNFVHRYPFSAVCIALCIDKTPVVGVVHNPILGETFYAAKGQGAFLNGKPLSVSPTTELSQAVVATNIGYDRTEKGIDFTLGNLRALLLRSVRAVRLCGSAALGVCDVAVGRVDAYYEWGVRSWDIAAAVCIAREAGAVAMDPSLQELDLTSRRVLVCCSTKLGESMSRVLCHKHPTL